MTKNCKGLWSCVQFRGFVSVLVAEGHKLATQAKVLRPGRVRPAVSIATTKRNVKHGS